MNTGILELDKNLNLDKPQLIILESEDKIKLSEFAIEIANNIAFKQKNIGMYFDLDISHTKLLENIAKRPSMVEEDISNPKLHIRIEPNLSIKSICSKCRKWKKIYNIDFVIIDCFEHIRNYKKESVEKEFIMVDISNILKNVALDLNIVIFLLSEPTDYENDDIIKYKI